MLGEQLLQVGLDAVLDQAGVDAELVGRVVQHGVQVGDQAVVGLGVLHRPDLRDAGGPGSASGSVILSEHGGLIQLSGL